MLVPNEMKPTDDEVILHVRYTQTLGWVRVFILILWGLAGIVGPCFLMLPRGDFRRAIICIAGGSVLLVIGFEILFTKDILFCRDRIVKEWYFFGIRSIPYSRARLQCASRLNAPRNGKKYVIKEVGTSGSVSFVQVPIYCRAYLISPETDRQVAAALSYLAGIDSNSIVNREYRQFQRAVLPKEVLS
jgi:hypothetical protein